MNTITVVEDAQTVRVERAGQVHSGRWVVNEYGLWDLVEVEGEEDLLYAALNAWHTPNNEFTLTDEELVRQGGGHWRPLAR